MPSNPQRRRAGRPVLMWALLAGAAAALVAWPPVRFHRHHAGAKPSAGKGNVRTPGEAADWFWTLPLFEKADDVRQVVAELRSDEGKARKHLGRTPAIGGPTYLFVSGGGKVVSNESNEIGIELDGSATPGKADLFIRIGPLFGNAVRDGTGLFKAEDYANSSDFNALSSELNKRVKTNVFPALRQKATVGTHLRFAGVAGVSPDDASALPLRLVPLRVEFK